MKILVVSGVWCGDCVQQCPLLARIAEANPARIDLRFVDRDQHRDLTDRVRINGGDRVPAALFLAEDHELCAVYGDRTLQRYRALAVRQLGPSCPTGIVPPDKGEMTATLQDWLDEVERIQLMLRLRRPTPPEARRLTSGAADALPVIRRFTAASDGFPCHNWVERRFRRLQPPPRPIITKGGDDGPHGRAGRVPFSSGGRMRAQLVPVDGSAPSIS